MLGLRRGKRRRRRRRRNGKKDRRRRSRRKRGFLGVDVTLNSKYHQCEVHVVIGVEYYIHVPQVT